MSAPIGEPPTPREDRPPLCRFCFSEVRLTTYEMSLPFPGLARGRSRRSSQFLFADDVVPRETACSFLSSARSIRRFWLFSYLLVVLLLSCICGNTPPDSPTPSVCVPPLFVQHLLSGNSLFVGFVARKKELPFSEIPGLIACDSPCTVPLHPQSLPFFS